MSGNDEAHAAIPATAEEIRIDDLDPATRRRFLLFFVALDDGAVGSELADAVYRGGPEGIRGFGQKLSSTLNDAASFLEAVLAMGWRQHEPSLSVIGVEVYRRMLPSEAMADLKSLRGWRRQRIWLQAEVRDRYILIKKVTVKPGNQA